MGKIREGLDELRTIPPTSLTDAEVEELHLGLDELATRLEAARVSVTAAFEERKVYAADGSRSAAAWLARRRKRSPRATRAQVWLARRLRHMPLTAAGFEAGELSVEHARELAACREFSARHFADDEAFLVRAAVEQRSFDNFLRVLATWRNAVDHHKDESGAQRQEERRRLVLHRRGDGCLLFQDGFLPPVSAEAFLSELDRLERQLFEADWADAKKIHGENTMTGHLSRTSAQRRADALVEMAHRSRTAPADGQRPEPLVSVYVDYETVAGRLCELASGTPITPGQLLPLFTKADIERVVFGPGNRVIELGLRTRFYTGGLRRAIELRDRHCSWPGCTAPVGRCQVDHRIPYSRGGYTTQWNGRLLCDPHNLARNNLRGTPAWDALDDDPELDPDELAHRCRQRVAALARQRRERDLVDARAGPDTS